MTTLCWTTYLQQQPVKQEWNEPKLAIESDIVSIWQKVIQKEKPVIVQIIDTKCHIAHPTINTNSFRYTL